MNKSIFEKHNITEYYQTSDGNKFYTEHNAQTHAKSLKNKKVTKVEKDETTADDDEKLSAEERIKAIEEMETVEQVKKALKGEKAKTVIEAGNAMIDLLSKEE